MAVSELPGNPNAVWTVKTNIAGGCVSSPAPPPQATPSFLEYMYVFVQ